MTTRIPVPDLLPSTQYVVRIRAKSGSAYSEWTNRLAFTTISDTFNPSVPLNPTWVVVGDSFHGEWDAVTTNTNGNTITVTRYEIELVGNAVSKTVSVTATTDAKVTLDLPFEENRALFGTPQHTVTMRVRAVDNKDLKSAWTGVLSATNPAPGPVTSLNAVGGVGIIDVSWTAPADNDIIRYDAYIGAANIWSGNSTGFTFNTVTYTAQTIEVKAVDKFLQESTGVTDSATATSPFIVDTVPPNPPTAASVSTSFDGTRREASLDITWTASSSTDLQNYTIRYGPGASGPWNYQLVESDVTTARAYVTPGQQYYVNVRATDYTGNQSAWATVTSSPITAGADSTPPPTLAAPTVTVQGSSFIITWSASAAIDLKEYEVGVNYSGGTEVFYRTTATRLDFPLELNRAAFTTPRATIIARVKAVDFGGLGNFSPTGTATNNAPAAPTSLTNSVGANSITIGWTPPADTDLVGYNVYMGTSPSPSTKVATVDGTTFTATATAAQYFSVKALDAYAQESIALSGGPFTPTNPFIVDVTAPAVPTSLAATISNNANGIGSRASLTWTNGGETDRSGIEISYKRNADSVWSSVVFGRDAVSGIIDLTYAYTAYDFRIRAFDSSANYSAWSSTLAKSAVANTAPANVTGLTSSPGRDSILYSWTAVADTDLNNYEVTFSTSATFASGNITYLTGNATTLTVSGLSPSTTYYARVRAVDTEGLTSAAWSTTNTTETLAHTVGSSDGNAPSSSPTPTVTSGIGNLHVSWSPVANADLVTYEVHLSTTNDFTPGAGTKSAENMGTVIVLERTPGGAALAYDTTYYIKLIAKDADGSAAAGAQGSGTIARVAADDSTITADDVGAPTIADLDATNANVTTAQASANSKNTIYRGGTTPTPPGGGFKINDTWFDTANNNRIFVWNGSSWVANNLGTLAIENNAIGMEKIPFKDFGNLAGDGSFETPWGRGRHSNSSWTYINDSDAPSGIWYARYTPAVAPAATFSSIALLPTTSVVEGERYWIRGKIRYSSTVTAGNFVFLQFNVLNQAGTTFGFPNYRPIIVHDDQWYTFESIITIPTGGVAASANLYGDNVYRGAGTIDIDQVEIRKVIQTAIIDDAAITNAKIADATIDNAKIANLDAGKINTGILDADRIGANTIGVKHLSIGDFTNLFPGSNFEGDHAWSLPGNITVATDQFRSGSKSLKFTATATSDYNTTIPVQPGDQFYAELWARKTSDYNGDSSNSKLRFAVQPGGAHIASLVYGAAELTTDTWIKRTTTFTVPAGVYSMSASLGTASHTAGSVWIDDVVVRRKNGGELIVDGAITGEKLSTTLAFISNLTINSGGWIRSANYNGTTLGFSLSDTGLDIRSGVVNANTLVSGTGILNSLIINTGGTIQSANWNGSSTGFRLNESGLTIYNGSVKVDTLTAGTLGAAITIGAGANLILNGGYLKSNTYTGTTQATNPSGAGFYLGNDGIRIDQGIISASALVAGTISGTNTITLSGANAKIVGTGFELSGSGLTVTTGAIEAAALRIQSGNNMLPALWASVEVTGYGSINAAVQAVDTTNYYIGTRALRVSWSGASGTARGFGFTNNVITEAVPVEQGHTYFISFWARNNTTTAAAGSFGYIDQSGNFTSTGITNNVVTVPSSVSGWTRIYSTFVPPVGVTSIRPYFTMTHAAFDYTADALQVEEKFGQTTPGPWVAPGITSIDGALIRTGSIISTSNTGIGGTPLWSIPLNGAATFQNLLVRGASIVGSSGDGTGSYLSAFTFTTGSAGWRIWSDGSAEFNNITVRGNLQGNSSSIITGGNFRTASNIGVGGGPAGYKIDSTGIRGYSGGTTETFSVVASTGNVNIAGTNTIGGSTTVSGTTSLGGTLTVAGGISVTGAAGTAYIRGGGFTGTTFSGASGNGYILDVNGLYVGSGTIAAAALQIQQGQNVLPGAIADFELPESYYPTNSTITNGTMTVTTVVPKFGTQSLTLARAGAASQFYAYLAPNTSVASFPLEPSTVYIVSAYVRNRSAVSTSVNLGIRCVPSNTNTASTPVTPTVSSNTWQRVSFVVTTPAGTTGGIVYIQSSTTTAGAQFDVDGFQVEAKMGGLNTPSPWTAPGLTKIDGAMITTGAITSTAIAQVWDSTLNGGLGGYKVDPDGNPAWAITMAGNASFGNALVRGALVVGNTTSPDVTKQGYMASATYIPGADGWIMRADGTAEFRAVAIGSFNGNAIEDGTLSAEAIAGGTITSGISLAGMFETTSNPVTFAVSTTNGSATVTTSAGAFYADDVGVTITGTGIPANSTIITWNSSTSIVISANATATGTPSATIYRGRKVRISGTDGVTLYNASGTAIVELPTDPSRPARFSGSLFATDVHIADEFRLFGVNNSLGSGAVLQLNPGTYIPPAPAIDYNWNQGQLYNLGVLYNPSVDPYINTPTGMKYDPVNDKYYMIFSFFGTNVLPITKNVTVPSHYDTGTGFKCSEAFLVGDNDVAYGGWCQDATYFHFLTYNNLPAAGTRWYRQSITRTGINRAGGPIAGDAYGTSNSWYGETNDNGVHGFPTIAIYGGNIYTAKISLDGWLMIYKHSGFNTATITYAGVAATGLTGSLVSMEVGQFDYGTGSTYVAITWQNNAGSSVTVVMRDTGAAFVDDQFSWWVPNNKQPLGVAYRGTSTNDAAGYFQSFMNDGTVYDHTKLAHKDTGATITSRLAYRYDGTNPGYATSGVGTAGPNSTIATLTARRSRLVVSLPNGVTIPNTGTNSPNSLTFYSGSSTVYKFPESAGSSLQILELRTSNASGTAGALASGTASQITASNGLVITGAGDITARHVTATGTGWIALTLGTNVNNVGFGWADAQAKRIGDFVYIRGLVVTAAALGAGATIATIPSTVYGSDFASIQVVSTNKLNTAGDPVASRFDCNPSGRVITTKLALASGEYIPLFAVLHVG